jgi:hypothetical protein
MPLLLQQPRRLPGGVVEDPQLKRLLDTEGSKADSAVGPITVTLMDWTSTSESHQRKPLELAYLFELQLR